MVKRIAAVVWLLSCVGVPGCTDDFDPNSLVAKPRPLAARVEVEGDPSRAWPRTGEGVEIQWLFVGPSGPVPLTWAFAACAGLRAPTGDLLCTAEPFGFGTQFAETLGPAVFPVVIPPSDEIPPGSQIVVLGLFCADGEIRLDGDTADARCEGAGVTAARVSLAVSLAEGGSPNTHPTLDDSAIQFAGAPWQPDSLDDQALGCAESTASPRLPTVMLGSDDDDDPPKIRLTVPESARETFEADGVAQQEELLVSHFSTAGELDRQFSVLDGTEPEVEVEWELPDPADVPPEGLRVRFFFVVRDGRGGVVWTDRSLCVVVGP